METEIIFYSEPMLGIRQPSRLQYFQIALPRNTEKIIGVEAGAWKLWGVENNPGVPDIFAPPIEIIPRANVAPAFLVKATPTIGLLTLKTPGAADTFFYSEIRHQDNALFFGEPNVFGNSFGEWSHGRNRAIDSVDIKGEKFIEGYFQDSWEKFYPSTAYYFLHVYLWIQKTAQE